MKISEIFTKVERIESDIVVFESRWVKNKGWGVLISAITNEPSANHPKYSEVPLYFFQGFGGDMRIYIRDVPPWPEVEDARDLGMELSTKYTIPYMHNAPDDPVEDVIRWWDSDI
jgi:hypothetical protein